MLICIGVGVTGITFLSLWKGIIPSLQYRNKTLLPCERISLTNTAKLLNGRFASCSRLAASGKPGLPQTPTPGAAVPGLSARHYSSAKRCPLPEHPAPAQPSSFPSIFLQERLISLPYRQPLRPFGLVTHSARGAQTRQLCIVR